MKLVQSFWSKPFTDNSRFDEWRNKLYMFGCWSLSSLVNKPHFTSNELITDDYGADLFINKLGLEFDNVDLSLNEIDHPAYDWWMGKQKAYSVQEEPFVHVDNDLIMFKPLKPWVLEADMFGEVAYDSRCFFKGFSPKGKKMIKETIKNQFKIPSYSQTAIRAGIFGANNIDYVKEFIDKTNYMKTTLEPTLERLKYRMNGTRYNSFFEEFNWGNYALSKGIHVETIIHGDWLDHDRQALDAGYTHLLSNAKFQYGRRVMGRLKKESPRHYEKCVQTYKDMYGSNNAFFHIKNKLECSTEEVNRREQKCIQCPQFLKTGSEKSCILRKIPINQFITTPKSTCPLNNW